MAVSNRTDPSTGAMLFSEAAVTTPAGKRLLLKPVAGRSFMVIVQPDGTLSGTGVQYFAAGYKDKDKATAGNPADRDSGLVFASPSSLVSIASPGGGDGWVVGDGALFPFSVSVFGRAVDGSRFNDSLNVLSTDRSGRIGCASLSNADSHCDNSTLVSQLAAGAKVWTLELYSRTLRQLELVKSVSFYKLGD